MRVTPSVKLTGFLTVLYAYRTVLGGARQSDHWEKAMRFGERVRQLRFQRNLTQQKLAELLGVSLSYVNKVENGRLTAGDYPSEAFVHKLADALEANEDELLMLTDRVPPAIRQRIRERPDVFRTLASMNDAEIDKLMKPLAGPDS